MIPLVKPTFPSWKDIDVHFSGSRKSGALTNFGPCFKKATNALSSHLSRPTLPVATGTAAIQLALQTRLKRGSRVIVPDYTHIGTLQAVVAAGMTPIISKCDHTLTLSLKDLETLNSTEYEAIIVVSPFGYRVDFQAYDEAARRLKKEIIYDLAGAWGMNPTTTNPVCFSFHATKNFSCGEGGAVSFSNTQDWETARRLSNFDTLPTRKVASQYGSNLKPDELKCAIILAQLERNVHILERVKRKKELLHWYQNNLKDLCTPHELFVGNAAPSLCVLTGMAADLLERRCEEFGLVMKRYYICLSEMDGLSDVRKASVGGAFFRTCVALPSDVSQAEAEKVIEAVRAIALDARADLP